MKLPYDPAALVVSWGPYLIQGFMDGTFVEAARDEDAFTKKVGADGEVARARNRNRAGTVTFTLMQTSSSNNSLSAEALNDELAGTGIYPLMIKDLLGTTLLMAPHAWVKKRADADYAKELGGRSWAMDCDQLTGIVGGNPDQ